MRDCKRFEHPRLGPRMKFLVHLSQPPARHVGVHFRGADAGMAEEFLDYPQVGAVFEVRRDAMTQNMWSDVAPKASAPDPLLAPQPERHRREALWLRTLVALNAHGQFFNCGWICSLPFLSSPPSSISGKRTATEPGSSKQVWPFGLAAQAFGPQTPS